MSDIAAKEFAHWILPRDAIRQVAKRFGDAGNAALALFGRLKDGILVAAAERAESHGVNSAFKVIPPDHWRALEKIKSGASLWQSGDIVIEARSGQSTVSIGYHGIRLDPHQVDKLLTGTPSSADPEPVVAETAEPIIVEAVVMESVEARPMATELIVVEVAKPPRAPGRRKLSPISKGHLKAWFGLYKAVYGGTPGNTLSFALQSAQGMFPDKAVTRSQIRQLAAGGRAGVAKRGRRKPPKRRRRPSS